MNELALKEYVNHVIWHEDGGLERGTTPQGSRNLVATDRPALVMVAQEVELSFHRPLDQTHLETMKYF